MVKILTMVKNECDIVEDWIVYHGSMFGFNNIYIIDNYSTDGTYEKIAELKEKTPINVYREADYKLKGDYMTNLIKKYCRGERFSFPIDIDEFIVFYDKNTNKIRIDKPFIINYFQHLPEYKVYKTNYIFTKMTKKGGYKRATTEQEWGHYSDYGKHAKSFFTTALFIANGAVVDHGNHYMCSDYFLTDLCLIHYHCRNTEQMKEKIKNNILGLGYKYELQSLRDVIQKNGNCTGHHHIKNQILVFENNYSIPTDSIDKNDISLVPLLERIKGGYF